MGWIWRGKEGGDSEYHSLVSVLRNCDVGAITKNKKHSTDF